MIEYLRQYCLSDGCGRGSGRLSLREYAPSFLIEVGIYHLYPLPDNIRTAQFKPFGASVKHLDLSAVHADFHGFVFGIFRYRATNFFRHSVHLLSSAHNNFNVVSSNIQMCKIKKAIIFIIM